VTELVEPVVYALRRSTPTELVEVLTVQTRTAESLPHVVGHRLWKLIKTRAEWHRLDHAGPPADEEGRAYAALLARRQRQAERNRQRATELGLGRSGRAVRPRAVDRIAELAARFRASGRGEPSSTGPTSARADTVIPRWPTPDEPVTVHPTSSEEGAR
jgi:hypothetical protein